MKEKITINQWNDLTKEQKWEWLYFIRPKNLFPSYYNGWDIYQIETEMENTPSPVAMAWFPTVCEMLEFLGEYWIDMIAKAYDMDMELFSPHLYYQYEPECLCDSLWEAVKYKLK